MRDLYWDVVKGSGVFFVLLTHTGMKLNPYFHMYLLSLFFFVAGYFYNEKYNGAPCTYIAKKIQQLWLPTIGYALFFLLLHNVFLAAGFYTSSTDAMSVSSLGHNIYPYYEAHDFVFHAFRNIMLLELEELPSALWFLPMMFFDLIFLCTTLHIRDKITLKNPLAANIFTVCSWLLIYASGCILLHHQISIEWHMQVGMALFAPVATGWAYRRCQQKIPAAVKAVLPVAGLCVLVGVYKYTGTHVELSQNRIISPLLFPLVTVAGFAAHLGLSRIIMKMKFLPAFFSLVGKHGLFIIATHFFAFRLVSLLLIKTHGLPAEWLPAFPCIGFPIMHGSWWLIYLIGGTAITLTMAEGIDYLKKKLSHAA